jgi:arginase
MKNIDIIAACSDLGLHVIGTQKGPEILINNINKNNINEIKKINYDNKYIKDFDTNNLKKNLYELNIFNEKLYKEVNNSLNNNMLPITLGGDHSIAIASALASINKYHNMGIIWFDAHGDFNTFETTTSGNIHGLPFAAVTGYEKTLLSDFHNGNYFNFKNAVLLGARDIDEPHELNNLKNAGITIITTDDIKKYGIDAMYEKAFSIASNGTNGIHISYDLDCIDCDIAPGVSIPVKNGINLDEAYGFVDYMIKNKEKIKSIDLVELNPTRDINKITEKIALNILNKLINNI